MGMDVTARLVDPEIIARLHQDYGTSDNCILVEVAQCFCTERNMIWACTADIEDAIQVAIDCDLKAETLEFLKILLAKVKESHTADSVLINLSY